MPAVHVPPADGPDPADGCERCGVASPLVDEHVCALPDPCRITWITRGRCLYGTQGCAEEHRPSAQYGVVGRLLRRLVARP